MHSNIGMRLMAVREFLEGEEKLLLKGCFEWMKRERKKGVVMAFQPTITEEEENRVRVCGESQCIPY